MHSAEIFTWSPVHSICCNWIFQDCWLFYTLVSSRLVDEECSSNEIIFMKDPFIIFSTLNCQNWWIWQGMRWTPTVSIALEEMIRCEHLTFPSTIAVQIQISVFSRVQALSVICSVMGSMQMQQVSRSSIWILNHIHTQSHTQSPMLNSSMSMIEALMVYLDIDNQLGLFQNNFNLSLEVFTQDTLIVIVRYMDVGFL